MIKLAVVGLGKMGLSHLSIARPHPEVDLVAVCDSTAYVLGVLSKYTGLTTYTDYERMLDEVRPDAVVIATPSHLHAPMVRSALERDVHVFCEKPLFLDPTDGAELTALAAQRGLVTQVGYHNRFVGPFQEVRRLLDAGAIGPVTSVLAEAYGPVVLKQGGRSWRSQKTLGGGALFDYAAHPLNLLTWYLGEPEAVGGCRLDSVFSQGIDDAVAATLHYPGTAAVLSVNWSDESQRKMSTRVSLWGEHGKIYADRQEIQVYLRDTAPPLANYQRGWNVKYSSELTPTPWFYVRGEEYSAQLDAFVRRVAARQTDGTNTFASATLTDRVLEAITRDAASGSRTGLAGTSGLAGQDVPAALAARPSRRRKARRRGLAGGAVAARLTAGWAARLLGLFGGSRSQNEVTP